MNRDYRSSNARRKKNKKHTGLGFAAIGALLAVIVLTSFALASCIDSNAASPVSGATGQSLQNSNLPQSTPVSPSVPASEPEPEPQPETLTVKFSAVGDNLIHSAVFASAATHAGGDGYDFTFCYENAKYFFEDNDVNWINQETLISSLPASTYPCFSTPVELGHAAYEAGWRVFALSNNHTYDMGAKGIAATREFWASMPNDTFNYGLYTNKEDGSGIPVQEVNGMSIAYVAFTEHTNGINTPANAEAVVIYTSEHAAMEAKVRAARQLADVVVVSVHWGVEDSHNIVQAQRDLAASFAEWGADVVLGTHPHVVQDLELIESSDGRPVLVAYSLGNFLSAQSQPDQLIGLALNFELSILVQPDGIRGALEINDVKVYPTVTQYEYTGGQYYVNPRTYMYRDYTDELAAVHPVRSKNASFGRAYIQSVVEQYVDSRYLVLD